jgi:small subunit ribosomal protein S4e
MANKGGRRHINRLASSKYMKVGKKTSAYVTKPMPGRHTLDSSIALGTVLKEKLGIVNSISEAEAILRTGAVKVNGKAIKEQRYPVGFGDVIELVPSNKRYIINIDRFGAFAIEESTSKQMFKVVGKYMAKNGKIMMRLNNGIILPAESGVKTNDTIELHEGKKTVIKMEPGRKCLVITGTHASERGTIKEIKQGSAQRDPLVSIEGSTGMFETLLDNIMVIS